MSVKQNAIDHALRYPLAKKVVDESFYVDDGLTGQTLSTKRSNYTIITVVIQ